MFVLNLLFCSLSEVENKIKESGASKEILASLSTLEIQLLNRYELLYSRGKGGRKVPVLLPVEINEALTTLCNAEIRQSLGIESPLLFAKKAGIFYLIAKLYLINPVIECSGFRTIFVLFEDLFFFFLHFGISDELFVRQCLKAVLNYFVDEVAVDF